MIAKTCAAFGETLAPKSNERPYRFEKRITCGKSCALRLRKKPILSPRTRYRRTKIDGKMHNEHRFIMQQHLGRPLLSSEVVHHVNENTLDNRIENLSVMTHKEHAEHHNRKHPQFKPCVVCSTIFEPHPTKRARAQTCGPNCKSALLKLRIAARIIPP